jgi:hypothetical protein
MVIDEVFIQSHDIAGPFGSFRIFPVCALKLDSQTRKSRVGNVPFLHLSDSLTGVWLFDA